MAFFAWRTAMGPLAAMLCAVSSASAISFSGAQRRFNTPQLKASSDVNGFAVNDNLPSWDRDPNTTDSDHHWWMTLGVQSFLLHGLTRAMIAVIRGVYEKADAERRAELRLLNPEIEF